MTRPQTNSLCPLVLLSSVQFSSVGFGSVRFARSAGQRTNLATNLQHTIPQSETAATCCCDSARTLVVVALRARSSSSLMLRRSPAQTRLPPLALPPCLPFPLGQGGAPRPARRPPFPAPSPSAIQRGRRCAKASVAHQRRNQQKVMLPMARAPERMRGRGRHRAAASGPPLLGLSARQPGASLALRSDRPPSVWLQVRSSGATHSPVQPLGRPGRPGALARRSPAKKAPLCASSRQLRERNFVPNAHRS